VRSEGGSREARRRSREARGRLEGDREGSLEEGRKKKKKNLPSVQTA
jgi:hypothetical protein